jgi:peptidoglycan hydrolase CwlO-like protein
MKKLIFALIVSLVVMSCGSASTEAPTISDSISVKDSVIKVVDSVKVDSVKAK